MTGLADDFFFIAHDERSGRGRATPPVIGIGLAAALFGELLLAGNLTEYDGELCPMQSEPPADPLLREILGLVCSRPQDPGLAGWLNFIATEAITDVGDRMVASGLVTRVERRRFRGARPEYLPIDGVAGAWPAIRLAGMLSRREPLTLQDAVLAGLVQGTGLLGHVLWDGEAHRPGYGFVQELLPVLPRVLRSLVTWTEVAVGDVLLTKRT